MNPFDLPPLAALMSAAASALNALGALVTPFAAIVLVTLVVRALLIPVGVSTARAARDRRRLAPQLAELQRRHRKNPEKLQRETMALYQREKVSPLAGCLPMLAQLPVISVVYGLFAYGAFAGVANPLMGATVWGARLDERVTELGPALVAGDALFLVAALVLAVVAWFQRRLTLRDAPDPVAVPATGQPGAPAWADPRGPLSWAPFLGIVAIPFVPLAAVVYLMISGTWAYLERRILRRIYA